MYVKPLWRTICFQFLSLVRFYSISLYKFIKIISRQVLHRVQTILYIQHTHTHISFCFRQKFNEFLVISCLVLVWICSLAICTRMVWFYREFMAFYWSFMCRKRGASLPINLCSLIHDIYIRICWCTYKFKCIMQSTYKYRKANTHKEI